MNPLVIGLTGSIGSGKSTVLQVFRDLGLPCSDADTLARQVVMPGSEGLGEIVQAFGPQVLQADGALDRRQLASLVFNDHDARTRLEGIIHPRVRTAELEFIRSHATYPAVVLDVPLLFESGFDALCDYCVTVTVSDATRRHRLALRSDRLSDAEIERRLAAQWPQERKVAASDAVIDNDGTQHDTRRQVHALLHRWLPDTPIPSLPDPS